MAGWDVSRSNKEEVQPDFKKFKVGGDTCRLRRGGGKYVRVGMVGKVGKGDFRLVMSKVSLARMITCTWYSHFGRQE